MERRLHKLLRISLLPAVIVLPLCVMLLPPRQPGSGFWWDTAIALGFSATGLLLVMFVLSARSRFISRPFGIDLIYYFHRQLSFVIIALVLAHPLILILLEPLLTAYLKPDGPFAMQAGLAALIGLLLLVAAALLHRYLRYEIWRRSHALPAVFCMFAVLVHILGVNYYVAPLWKKSLILGVFAGWAILLIVVRLIHPWRLSKQPWQLIDITAERGRAWTLTLVPQHTVPFQFQAGQFAWLTIRASPFAMCEHPFSIASAATETGQLRFTIKELGDCTRQLKTLPMGETFYVDGPYGAFCAEHFPAADAFVFIVGGIGIVPVMSMLRTLQAKQDRRPVTLFYGAHSLDMLTFYEELTAMASDINLTLHFVLQVPPTGRQGESGCITPTLLADNLPPVSAQTEYFICGPPPMMKLVESGLRQQGIHYAQIHAEIFNLL
ncbi:MAG: ferric reductase-like transmembrane domain-containing protein [Gammaproteobacteria bacterium]|nr:ferric reductase-like transmembrane domain-containing protein [Gammaproteobacteria bacterium]MDH5650660.1 ferric reductase-like transmembrane domain-containing protein [Gammaproteobacteria bacterium]